MSDQVEIKKGFLGGYTIGYDCRNCSSRLKSPLDDAGKPDTCPDCGTQFVVPGVAEKDRIHAEAAAAGADKQRQHELAMKQAEADRQRQNEQDRRRSQEDAALKAIRQESVAASRNEHRPCPYCGEEILAVAKKCKHCGEFLDDDLRRANAPRDVGAMAVATKPAKKSNSTAVGCLVVMALVGGCFMLLPDVDHRRSSTVPAADLSPAKQQERKALIDRLISEGVFYKVEQPATLPHVWVTPLFRAMDYDFKQNAVSVVYLYYQPANMVVLKDSLTGERIGSYSPDLGLSIE